LGPAALQVPEYTTAGHSLNTAFCTFHVCSYEAPEDYTECLAALGPITTANIDAALACESTYGQGNYHNSMMALDMTTGAIR
jgi:hypothetical protein